MSPESVENMLNALRVESGLEFLSLESGLEKVDV